MHSEGQQIGFDCCFSVLAETDCGGPSTAAGLGPVGLATADAHADRSTVSLELYGSRQGDHGVFSRRSRPSLCSRASFPPHLGLRPRRRNSAGTILAKSGPMATQRTMKRTLTVFAASPRRSSTRRVVRSPRSAFQAIPGKSQSSGFPSWGWLSGTLRTECHDGLAIKVCEIPSGGVRSWIDTVV